MGIEIATEEIKKREKSMRFMMHGFFTSYAFLGSGLQSGLCSGLHPHISLGFALKQSISFSTLAHIL